MRNLSVINRSPNGRSYRNDNSKNLNAASSVISRPNNSYEQNIQNIDLRAKLYNSEAAAQIKRLAAENTAKHEPFDPVAFENFVKDHPLFSKLHLVVGNDAEEGTH